MTVLNTHTNTKEQREVSSPFLLGYPSTASHEEKAIKFTLMRSFLAEPLPEMMGTVCLEPLIKK